MVYVHLTKLIFSIDTASSISLVSAPSIVNIISSLKSLLPLVKPSGHKVVVEPLKEGNRVGKITKIIGHKNDVGVDIL